MDAPYYNGGPDEHRLFERIKQVEHKCNWCGDSRMPRFKTESHEFCSFNCYEKFVVDNLEEKRNKK
jgi:hypothetical protein